MKCEDFINYSKLIIRTLFNLVVPLSSISKLISPSDSVRCDSSDGSLMFLGNVTF